MANWCELYKASVLETNPIRLRQLIRETEGAIFQRLQQLAKSSNGAGERHQIEEASAALLILKIERLNEPDSSRP
jgi:hypothetical protein